jgi:UDP-2-acetamido-2,6-beta-L-arabino-hexul-4-ose reductase
MIKIGISGQAGFVGSHLFNTLGLYPGKFERVEFRDKYFQNDMELQAFVKTCDVVVHLAAMNRHNEPEVIYNTNIGLVKRLIAACEATNSTPHILFSSSTHEERDSLYGKSKKEGRQLLEQWARNNNAQFTGLIIPNIFGPFGRPYFNSVVATFCYQLTHNEAPRIDVDSELELIYVGELVNEIILNIELNSVARSKTKCKITENTVKYCETIYIPHTSTIKVSELLQILETYKSNYFEKGEIPNLNSSFDRNLWYTFICYLDHEGFFPYHLKLNADNRGSFVETVKLNSGGQVSFSTTGPGITRGNHFHTRKAERFAVIKGKATIELRRIGTEKVMTFELDGNRPSFVDMPIWHTHNITNTGDNELYTIFWINEHYDANDSDTFFEKV